MRYLISFLLLSSFAQAQGLGDLFGQSKKLRQNYLAQLAALRSFRAELKQGYRVVTGGLSGISQISTTELKAHEAYYASLSSTVTPDPRIPELASGILKISKDPEILKQTRAALDDYADLLSGKYQLTDEERLQRRDKVREKLLILFYRSRQYVAEQQLYEAQQLKEHNNTKTLKKLYEIP